MASKTAARHTILLDMKRPPVNVHHEFMHSKKMKTVITESYIRNELK